MNIWPTFYLPSRIIYFFCPALYTGLKQKYSKLEGANLWKCCSLMDPIKLFVDVCRLCLTMLAWRSHSGLWASIKSEPERWNTGKKNWKSTCQNSQLLQGNSFTVPVHLLDQVDPDLLWRSLQQQPFSTSLLILSSTFVCANWYWCHVRFSQRLSFFSAVFYEDCFDPSISLSFFSIFATK